MYESLASYFPQTELASSLTDIRDSATPHSVVEFTDYQGRITRVLPNINVRKLEEFIHQVERFAHEALLDLAEMLSREKPILLNPSKPPADFEYTKAWGPDPRTRCANAVWTSKSLDSFLASIEVVQTHNRSMQIHLSCRPASTEEFKHQLMLFGFSERVFLRVFKAETRLELDVALYFISQYAKLEDGEFDFIKKQVGWRTCGVQSSAIVDAPLKHTPCTIKMYKKPPLNHKDLVTEKFLSSVSNLKPFEQKASKESEQPAVTIRMPPSSTPKTPVICLEDLKDPATKIFMENAVILAPCGHSLSSSLAHRFTHCPACTKPIDEYAPNPVLRSIIELVRRVHASFCIQTVLTKPPATVAVAECSSPSSSFPEGGTRFIYIKEWQTVKPDPKRTSCREMILRSDHDKAPIVMTHIRGYKNGSLAVSVMCHQYYREAFNKLLKEFNLSANTQGVCTGRTSQEIIWLLKFLLARNTFPEGAKKILEQFKDMPNWRSWELK